MTHQIQERPARQVRLSVITIRLSLTLVIALFFGVGLFKPARAAKEASKTSAEMAQWAPTSGPEGGAISALLVYGPYLFAATYGNGIFRSTNNGGGWQAVNSGLAPLGLFVDALATNGAYLFAGTDSGAFRSNDNGQSWTPVSAGLPARVSVTALVESGGNLFAGTYGGGVCVSTDNGQSWAAVSNGLSDGYILSLAVSGSSLFAGTNGGGVFILPDAAAQGYEADVAPRPNGSNNGAVTITDWAQIGRFVAGLDTASNGNEFQRADCAPKDTLGNGQITITDWAQAGRYAAGLDPVTPAGGPTNPTASVIRAMISGEAAAQAEAQLAGADRARIMTPITSPGQANVLTIQLDARGDENALGLSLRFDPTRLRFEGATLGDKLSGATLVINTSRLASGRVGIALALPAGQTLTAGRTALAQVRFSAATGSLLTGARVSFGDEPVAREASDVNANPVAVICADDAAEPKRARFRHRSQQRSVQR